MLYSSGTYSTQGLPKSNGIVIASGNQNHRMRFGALLLLLLLLGYLLLLRILRIRLGSSVLNYHVYDRDGLVNPLFGPSLSPLSFKAPF